MIDRDAADVAAAAAAHAVEQMGVRLKQRMLWTRGDVQRAIETAFIAGNCYRARASVIELDDTLKRTRGDV